MKHTNIETESNLIYPILSFPIQYYEATAQWKERKRKPSAYIENGLDLKKESKCSQCTGLGIAKSKVLRSKVVSARRYR